MYRVLVVGQSEVNGQGKPHFSAETVPTMEEASFIMRAAFFDVLAVEDTADLPKLGNLPVRLVSLVAVRAPVKIDVGNSTQVVVLGPGSFVDELVRVIKNEISEKVSNIQTTAFEIQKVMSSRLAAL